MATSKKRNVSVENCSDLPSKQQKTDLNPKIDLILQSRKHANDVFDILECLQSDRDRLVVHAVEAVCRLFSSLLERGALYRGDLPDEDTMLAGERSAEEQYSMFMRHRYHSAEQLLLDLLTHPSYQLQEKALCGLVELAGVLGRFPLEDLDWTQHYRFPRALVQGLVEVLVSGTRDQARLIARFASFLEMDDLRYYVMSCLRESLGRTMDKNRGTVLPVYQTNMFCLLSSIAMPTQETDIKHFLVTQPDKHADWKAAKLKEHKRAFEKLWLGFLKHQLPGSMYKKVLVILHDSILPHMSQPTLMIDFLTAAYDVGGAISLLALNGLFVLIHQHNLEYPDFYKKLYNLLDPSVFHAKYRARFFHLTNLFLSSTHLPVYLVAAFIKRLSRLALTAPPAALLMVLPFLCNLIVRHPATRALIHRPAHTQELCDDPYLMEEEDPALSHALESSLWEIQTLQKHYHPDVARAAAAINKPLPQPETDLGPLLELTTFQLMQRDLKQSEKRSRVVALEFEPPTALLPGSGGPLGTHFSLE